MESSPSKKIKLSPSQEETLPDILPEKPNTDDIDTLPCPSPPLENSLHVEFAETKLVLSQNPSFSEEEPTTLLFAAPALPPVEKTAKIPYEMPLGQSVVSGAASEKIDRRQRQMHCLATARSYQSPSQPLKLMTTATSSFVQLLNTILKNLHLFCTQYNETIVKQWIEKFYRQDKDFSTLGADLTWQGVNFKQIYENLVKQLTNNETELTAAKECLLTLLSTEHQNIERILEETLQFINHFGCLTEDRLLNKLHEQLNSEVDNPHFLQFAAKNPCLLLILNKSLAEKILENTINTYSIPLDDKIKTATISMHWLRGILRNFAYIFCAVSRMQELLEIEQQLMEITESFSPAKDPADAKIIAEKINHPVIKQFCEKYIALAIPEPAPPTQPSSPNNIP